MDIESTEIERLFIANHQRLYAVARQMLKDDAEAGDAVSDVFAKLVDGSLKLPQPHPEGYLMAAVRNLCLDRLRRMTVREKIERSLSLQDVGPVITEQERERVVEMISYAERTFPPQTWRVFQLRFDDGLLYREIAERLAISEVAVYKHLADALERLKKKYNPTRR